MLDRLSPALRHFLIGLLAAALTVVVPLLTDHQSQIRDWIVGDLHLPLAAAPLVGAALAQLILFLTSLTRQYGVGSTPVDAPVDRNDVDAT